MDIVGFANLIFWLFAVMLIIGGIKSDRDSGSVACAVGVLMIVSYLLGMWVQDNKWSDFVSDNNIMVWTIDSDSDKVLIPYYRK